MPFASSPIFAFLNTQNHVSEQIFHFNCCKAGPKMHGNNHECGLHRSWSIHGPRGPSHVTSSRPLASWLSLPHYSVRLTPADPDTPVKSQQWLPRGAAGLTIHFYTFLFSPLPLSTQIHSTFLSSHVLTRLFFPPSLVTLHPIMWSHDAMTEYRAGRIPLLSHITAFNTTTVHAGRGKYQQQWRTPPSQQLLGGGHWQISLTQKHSSSLPHTCSSVLFGLDSTR